MRLHTLVFALCVFRARSATIPEKADVVFEKKLADAVKEELIKDGTLAENTASEQELIDQATTVKDVENNLRKGVIVADIPVKVVVEDYKPTLKLNDEYKDNNEVVPGSEESIDIKRVEIDLKNPGPPQRMQHDNQNPDHFEDHQQDQLNVKQNSGSSPNIFDNFGFPEEFQSWFTNNQQVAQIQQNIQQIQDNFEMQVNKLNSTIQKFWKPDESKPSELIGDSQTQTNVNLGLETLEKNIKDGDKSLTERVNAVASVKAENSTTASGPGGWWNPGAWQTNMQQAIANMQSQFQNMTNLFQEYIANSTQQSNSGNVSVTNGSNVFTNIFSPSSISTLIQQGNNKPNGTQSDEGATLRPTIWQTFQDLWPRPGQVQQDETQPAPNLPILQTIQNNFQNFIGSFQQNKPATTQPTNQKPEPQNTETQKPEVQTPEAQKPEVNKEQEGSNAVPESKPDEQQKKPQTVQSSQSGPIKQIIERNPIVQGIAGAVQRLQHTINPEKPRDSVKEAEKGIVVVQGGHRPLGAATGNNNDVDGGRVTQKFSEDVIPEVLQEPLTEEVKEEVKAPEVSDKDKTDKS